MPEIICQCDTCKNEATVAYCNDCYDSIKEEDYERGKTDGKEEAEEEAKEADKN